MKMTLKDYIKKIASEVLTKERVHNPFGSPNNARWTIPSISAYKGMVRYTYHLLSDEFLSGKNIEEIEEIKKGFQDRFAQLHFELKYKIEIGRGSEREYENSGDMIRFRPIVSFAILVSSEDAKKSSIALTEKECCRAFGSKYNRYSYCGDCGTKLVRYK